MVRTGQMARLSKVLDRLSQELQLPDDITLVIDVDPANLA